MIISEKIDNIELYFDPEIEQKDEILEKVLSSYEKNVYFFGTSLKDIYEVHLLYERREMDEVLGAKTESWLVGTTTRKGIIYTFSPKKFTGVSSHPVENFCPVLTHELAHLFLNEKSKFYQPVWLNEGVAGYIAEQYKDKKPKRLSNFTELHKREDWDNHPNYAQAACFVSYLVEVFGKEKLLQFLGMLSQYSDAQEDFKGFTELFSKHFLFNFKQVVEEWKIKTLPQ